MTDKSTGKRIGFIGLGNMGGPMARRLVEAGHDVVVADLRQEAVDDLVKRGATAAATPAEVGGMAEIVLASLPTPTAVRAVVTGPGGLVEAKGLRIFVDLSTTGAVVEREVAAALASRGVVTVDSPVSGGTRGAEAGTLTLMIAGDAAAIEEVRPFLDVIGKNHYVVGAEPGLGQTLKLCNNYLSAANQVIAAEAMVTGVKAGLDPQVMLDVINKSSGRNTATDDKIPTFVLPRTFHGGFTTELLHKDVRLFTEEAEAMGVPMWVASNVRHFLSYAIGQGTGQVSSTTMITHLEKAAGVEVGTKAKKAEAAE